MIVYYNTANKYKTQLYTLLKILKRKNILLFYVFIFLCKRLYSILRVLQFAIMQRACKINQDSNPIAIFRYFTNKY